MLSALEEAVSVDPKVLSSQIFQIGVHIFLNSLFKKFFLDSLKVNWNSGTKAVKFGNFKTVSL